MRVQGTEPQHNNRDQNPKLQEFDQNLLYLFFQYQELLLDQIIQEFQYELVTRVRDWEILSKYFEKTFIATVLWIGFQLEELAERS